MLVDVYQTLNSGTGNEALKWKIEEFFAKQKLAWNSDQLESEFGSDIDSSEI